MKAVIYARKSKATDKGESIENQVDRCKKFCELKGWKYDIFIDYDISGKNLDRPKFIEMMNTLRNNSENYCALVCYKLDRISRSTRDFGNLREELKELDVAFVSIKENFDLTTPMGKAMMSISSVFAELERETIAERVRDNMIDLAKKGKWNGGTIPFGYNRVVENISFNDRDRIVSRLAINEFESVIVKKLFENYLKPTGSIRSTTFYLNNLGYKTKKGGYWHDNQVSRILKNALYCVADEKAFNYFNDHTSVYISNLKSEFDGTKGLLFYNRRKPNKNTSVVRNQEEWILSIADHQGIISGSDFAQTQLKLEKNKQHISIGKSKLSFLTGLLRCGVCGGRLDISTTRPTNKTIQYFICFNKNRVCADLCNLKNIRVDFLERFVLNQIFKFLDNEKIKQEFKNKKNNKIQKKESFDKKEFLQNQLAKKNHEIENLVNALASGTLPAEIIKSKYEKLEKEKNDIKIELSKLKTKQKIKKTNIFDIKEIFNLLTVQEKREFLKTFIKNIVVYDNKIEILIYKDFRKFLNFYNC